MQSLLHVCRILSQSVSVEVEYEKPAADLHTELFAKIPFPLEGKTLSDRMTSSVMQKPGSRKKVRHPEVAAILGS